LEASEGVWAISLFGVKMLIKTRAMRVAFTLVVITTGSRVIGFYFKITFLRLPATSKEKTVEPFDSTARKL
jgi:hypothetical protein